jgi:C1A family cysteine protease
MLADASNHKITSFQQIPQNANLVATIENALANNQPVLYAFLVYQSFESQATDTTGIVTLPKAGEQILGGHEVCIVGYNSTTQYFTIMNSWGTSWGDKGFCYFPYAYITNPAWSMQFCVITVPAAST